MIAMNNPISRLRSAHDVGEGWTAADARELYEIARWGKGYFGIGDNGQVQIFPTKDASRSGRGIRYDRQNCVRKLLLSSTCRYIGVRAAWSFTGTSLARLP